MNVRNCRGCGRLFNYITGAFLCPACREKMEEKFQEVKEFIRANPGVSLRDVARECDIDKAQIEQWLREERLEVTENSPIYLSCEVCGGNIRSGKYCDKCKANLTNDLRSVMRKPAVAKPEEPKKDRHKDAFHISGR